MFRSAPGECRVIGGIFSLLDFFLFFCTYRSEKVMSRNSQQQRTGNIFDKIFS